MASAPTTSELTKTAAVRPEDVEAAVTAYLADPTCGTFALGDDYTLDLAATVGADRWATAVLRSRGLGERTRRTAVRTAFMLACPKER